MNTPKPCSRCKHLYADCMQEDNPDYMAECKLISFPDQGPEPKWASESCPRFKDFEEKNRLSNTTGVTMTIQELIDSPKMMEIARKAVEDELIEWRDLRLSTLGRGNGLVIREYDRSLSSTIRFGMERAMVVGLKAIAAHLKGDRG